VTIGPHGGRSLVATTSCHREEVDHDAKEAGACHLCSIQQGGPSSGGPAP
jgi:hypothetical protein